RGARRAGGVLAGCGPRGRGAGPAVAPGYAAGRRGAGPPPGTPRDRLPGLSPAAAHHPSTTLGRASGRDDCTPSSPCAITAPVATSLYHGRASRLTGRIAGDHSS